MGNAESSEVDAALFGRVDGISDVLRDMFVVACT